MNTQPNKSQVTDRQVEVDLKIGDDEPEIGEELEVESYRYLAIEPSDVGEYGRALRDRVTGQLYLVVAAP